MPDRPTPERPTPERPTPERPATTAPPRDPLHGVTLQAMLEALVAAYGWPGLAERVPLRCFSHEPSMPSSLRLLRRTPWAREKVEGLYLFMQRDRQRAQRRAGRSTP